MPKARSDRVNEQPPRLLFRRMFLFQTPSPRTASWRSWWTVTTTNWFDFRSPHGWPPSPTTAQHRPRRRRNRPTGSSMWSPASAAVADVGRRRQSVLVECSWRNRGVLVGRCRHGSSSSTLRRRRRAVSWRQRRGRRPSCSGRRKSTTRCAVWRSRKRSTAARRPARPSSKHSPGRRPRRPDRGRWKRGGVPTAAGHRRARWRPIWTTARRQTESGRHRLQCVIKQPFQQTLEYFALCIVR